MNIMNKILLKSNSYNYYKSNYEKLKEENKNLKNQITKLDEEYNKILQKNNSQHKKEMENLIAQHNSEMSDLKSQVMQELNNNFNYIEKYLTNLNHSETIINNELKYAFIFNDTIKNSSWLDKTDFSLVNSAANYSFMYSLYRILNEDRPKNILELGLGQTTKLTSQYANHFDDVKLTVFETDEDWIEVFSENL